MKVLILVHNTARKGGAYYHGQCFAKALAGRGHAVTLMAIDAKARFALTEEDAGEFTLVHTPDLLWGIGRTGWDPWGTLRRCLYVRKRRYDVIHTVDTRPAVVLPALYARRKGGGVYVADWTDWWGRGGATTERESRLVRALIGPIEQFFEEYFKPLADGVITISHALFERAKGLGIDPATMQRIPPACDTGDVKALDMLTARASLGLDPDVRYVGYLGNIYPRDAELLVEAMTRLQASDAKLIVIGGANMSGSAVLAASGRLVETGHVAFSTMVAYLNACNVLSLPLSDSIANRGRWPSKINDYLAVGRPMVASAVGDMTCLFEEAEIGHAVGEGAEAFAAALDDLLGDPKRAAVLGNNARKLAETTYSMEALGVTLETFYNQTIARKRAGEPE